jgi:hypothetical protein
VQAAGIIETLLTKVDIAACYQERDGAAERAHQQRGPIALAEG